MKGSIKHWVLSRKRSLTEPRLTSRPSIEQTSSSSSPSVMHLVSEPVPPPPPPKKDFYAKGAKFRLDPRYTYHKTLGLGAYGIVCSANDSVLSRRVAVKKVARVFEDLTDAKRIIREIRLLSCMKHENILPILNIDEPESYDHFNDVYIVTELMDTDMHKLLRSKHPLEEQQRQFFAYQIFRALKYIHSASILHRDLKPANILISESCDLKICDFGLARYIDPADNQNKDMTEYVVTRWYRAPELLLSADEYTSAIDMWSAGCLLAELYSRRPLFPGSDVKNQIMRICKVLGKPTTVEIAAIENPRARAFIANVPGMHRADFAELLPNASPQAVDLVQALLQFDPRKRISAMDALEHPYLAEFRDPLSEITGAEIDYEMLEPPNEKKLGRDGIRRLMWEEILKFHPTAKSREPASAREAERRVRAVLNGA